MDFQKFSNPEYCGWLDPQIYDIESILNRIGSFEKSADCEVILKCRGRTIYRLPIAYSGSQVNCYLYLFHNDSLSRAFQSNYAFHSMDLAKKLAEKGFNTIEVLAALKPKRQILNWKGLLIAKEIERVKELPSEGTHKYQVHGQVEFDVHLQRRLAAELAALHNATFHHGDLKTRHILTQDRGNSEPSFYFVDLEKARYHPLLPGLFRDVMAARDLIQLFASLPRNSGKGSGRDLSESFLEQYLSARKLSSIRKVLIRKMLALYQNESGSSQGKIFLRVIFEKLTSRKGNQANSPTAPKTGSNL